MTAITATSARRHHRRGTAPDWREYLSSHERRDLEGLEANAQLCDDRRRALTSAIRLIRDRCMQRRRLAEIAASKVAAE